MPSFVGGEVSLLNLGSVLVGFSWKGGGVKLFLKAKPAQFLVFEIKYVFFLPLDRD